MTSKDAALVQESLLIALRKAVGVRTQKCADGTLIELRSGKITASSGYPNCHRLPPGSRHIASASGSRQWEVLTCFGEKPPGRRCWFGRFVDQRTATVV